MTALEFAIERLWPVSLPPSLVLGGLLSAVIIYYVSFELCSGLRSVPGPFLARFSNVYIARQVSHGRCHTLFNELHAEYGPIVRTAPKKLLIGDPDAVPIIYGTTSKFLKADFYDCFRRNFQGKLMDNIFTTKDPQYHKAMKTSVSSVYSLSSVQRMEKLVDENTHVFINKMETKAGQPVDLGDWVQWYAFDVIGTITFLKPFGCMQMESDVQNMIRNTDTSFRYVSVVGQMPKLHRWLLGSPNGVKLLSRIPFFAKANHWPYIGEVAAKAINEYDSRSEEEKGRCTNLLAGFRQAQARHPERLTDRDLMGFLFANIAAGSDTTAVTLRCLFYYLVRTPDCYAKLMDEIWAAENAGALSSLVTYQEGLNLKYLQAVIKETLRIHPGTPLPLERVVPPEGANLCGTFVPGGTTVGVSAWVVQQDKRVYGEDANEFRPERWLEADANQLRLMDRTFLTFGGGARSCIGKNISMLEVTKLVPQVLRKFKLEWASPEKEWVVESYFVAKQKGVIMRLIPHSVSVKKADTKCLNGNG